VEVAKVADGAARGAAWNVGTTLVTRAAGLVGTLLVTRFVAPEEMGEVSAAFVVVFTASGLTNLRFGNFLIAKQADAAAAFNANVVHIALGIVALAGVVLLRHPLADLIEAPGMARFIPLYALVAMIERVGYLPDRMLVREMQFRPLSIARAVGELAYSTISLGTAPFIGGMGLVVGSLVRSTLVTAMMVRAAAWKDYGPRAPIRWSTIREMLAYCAPLVVSGMAEFASSKWDNLLVSRYFGPRQLGMYNLAYNLADTPSAAVSEQANDVLFPSFAKLEPQHRNAALERATRLMALVVFPLAVGLGAVAHTVVHVFFDPRWAEVAPMLAILSILSVARPVALPLLSFLQAQHRPRAIMAQSLAKIVLLIAMVALFARWGPLWTCIGVGAAFVLHAALCLLFVRVLDGVSMLRVFFGVLPVLLACAAMAGAVVATRLAFEGIGSTGWLSLIVQIIVGGAAYIAAAFVVARPIAMDFVTQVRKIVRRKRGAEEAEA
jgi:PST family polysaccharide transporter